MSIEIIVIIVLGLLIAYACKTIKDRENKIEQLNKIIAKQQIDETVTENIKETETNIKADEIQPKTEDKPKNEQLYRVKNMNYLISVEEHKIKQHEWTNYWLFIIVLELGAIIFFIYYFYSNATEAENFLNGLMNQFKKYN